MIVLALMLLFVQRSYPEFSSNSGKLLLVKFYLKATFQVIFEQNCENTTGKKPETRTKVEFLFERVNISSKKPAHKIGSKLKKRPTV